MLPFFKTNRKGAPLRGIEMFDRDHRDLGPAELLRRQNRPWPAITLCSASISTGTLKPKLAMLLAIRSTCLRLCSRGFCGSSLNAMIGS